MPKKTVSVTVAAAPKSSPASSSVKAALAELPVATGPIPPPQTIGSTLHRKSPGHRLFVGLIVVLIVAAAAIGLYYYHSRKVALVPTAEAPAGTTVTNQQLDAASNAANQSLDTADSSMSATTESLNDQEGNLSEQ